jgi:hypothetical protein
MLGSSVPYTWDICALPGGGCAIAGSFPMPGGYHAATWDGSTWSILGGGLNGAAIAVAAQAATAVMEEVSKSVADKGIDAPEAKSSFVSMDTERAGLVDDEGLPLIYDKDAIQKYWAAQSGALQSRWLEFLGVTVPFLTRVAGLLISGGTDKLQSNARDLARDARVGIEKLGPTYIKMGQMLSVRPDVLPQEALDELQILQDGVEGFERSVAVAMVEKELGRPLMDVFEEFGENAAAAASSRAGGWLASKNESSAVAAPAAIRVSRPDASLAHWPTMSAAVASSPLSCNAERGLASSATTVSMPAAAAESSLDSGAASGASTSPTDEEGDGGGASSATRPEG